MEIKYRAAVFVILFLVVLSSCLKQEDSTAEGPKANITIINGALNHDSITLLIDNEKVNQKPIGYGQASGDSSNAYQKIKPGVHATAWLVGGGPAETEKFFPWEANSYYTMLTYGISQNKVAPWLLIKDNVEPSDSVAKARFFNCLAGKDTLSLWLLNPNDTIVVGNKIVWLGQATNLNSEFHALLAPGPWTMQLVDQHGTVLIDRIVTVNTRTVYSFVATGETGGMAEKAPAVLQVVQRK